MTFTKENNPGKNLELRNKISQGRKNASLFLEDFQREYEANGGNAAAAVRKLRPGLAEGTVKNIGSRLMQKLAFKKMNMVGALIEKGVGPDRIAKKILQLLNAKKIIKTVDKDGHITITEQVDINSIDRGITHALKIGIGGGYKPEEVKQSGVVGHAHFSLGELFRKAYEKEQNVKSVMNDADYQERVDGILAEARGERKRKRNAGIAEVKEEDGLEEGAGPNGDPDE